MPDKAPVDFLPCPCLRALVLEDDPWDAELVVATLRGANPALQAEVVNSPALFRQRLEESEFDIILADYNLGGWTAIEALEILRESGKSIPLVVVSGALGDEGLSSASGKGPPTTFSKTAWSGCPSRLIAPCAGKLTWTKRLDSRSRSSAPKRSGS